MRRISSFVVAAALAGCGIVQLVPSAGGGGGTAASDQPNPDGAHHIVDGRRTYRVGAYWGPECERDPVNARKEQVTPYGEPEPVTGKQPNLAHDPADQVLRLVCVERILSSANEPGENTWVMQHFRFDEIYFDHFTAALMLVQCLEAESCLGEGAPPEAEGSKRLVHRIPHARFTHQYYEVAMMRWYADHIDPNQVAARVNELPLPDAARRAFLVLLDRARSRVIAVSDELAPDARELFVGIPEQVYKQRAADRAPYAKLVADLAALIDRLKAERKTGKVSDATVAALDKLRLTYRASCRKSCTKDAIFAEITRQLFWAQVSRGDAPAAMAEAKLLDKLDPTAQEEIATRQAAAIEKAAGRLERVKAARAQGVDAEAASSTAQGTVIDLGDGRGDLGYVYRGSRDAAIHYDALVPDRGVGGFSGTISGLEPHGDKVVIRFADVVSSWSEGTGCYETSRIDSISDDGDINYREACTGSSTKTERHKVDPVVIPAAEAAGLHGGDELSGFAEPASSGPKVGRVWFVKRGARVARVRDVPL
ncbi:MAG TPA: hypothetical protein VLX92_09480 [Kofleriaceae bacterium]|nr:hypothetical protein [Kofleriaceae bacterium]